MTVAEDLRPTSTAMVAVKFEAIPTAEGLISSFLTFSKMEAKMQAFLCFNYTGATCSSIRLIWIIPQD